MSDLLFAASSADNAIKLGCCSFNFAQMPLASALRLSRDIGFRHVDVGLGQMSECEWVPDPARAGSALRRSAAEVGVELCELFAPEVKVNGRCILPSDPDPANRTGMLDRFRLICALAGEAGCQSVMGVPGKVHDNLGEQASWEIAVETLRAMVDIATEHGVAFNVEPAFRSLASRPEHALRLIKQVPRLGLTVDYAHFAAQEIELHRMLPLHAFARHIHAKQARPGYLKSFHHRGTIDFRPILADLSARAWTGVIALECIASRAQPEFGHPVYREVTTQFQPEPAPAGVLAHPATQTLLLAHDIDRILSDLQEPSP